MLPKSLHHLLHDLLGAYRHRRSADQVLLYVTDKIVQAFDAGKYVCAAFLDLCKAFDSLDHHLLLDCLFNLGVSGDGMLTTLVIGCSM